MPKEKFINPVDGLEYERELTADKSGYHVTPISSKPEGYYPTAAKHETDTEKLSKASNKLDLLVQILRSKGVLS